MKRSPLIFLGAMLVLTSLFGLTGCYDMHDQPSYKAQEGPRLYPPEGSVPIQGLEVWASEAPANPVARSEDSVEQGRALYAINCAMCHGLEGAGDGPVGKKWLVPPANLNKERIQNLQDGELFKRITEGYGTMPGLKKRVPPEDRWHIVNYIREFR
ncbi:MAG: cytochrome c [bacterium]|nr:cytochrome c [bacterium]